MTHGLASRWPAAATSANDLSASKLGSRAASVILALEMDGRFNHKRAKLLHACNKACVEVQVTLAYTSGVVAREDIEATRRGARHHGEVISAICFAPLGLKALQLLPWRL